MRLGVGYGQRRAPRPAHDDPARNPERLADKLEIGDKMRGGVLVERATGRAAPGAPLVEEDRAHPRRVEIVPLIRIAAASRPAMEEHGRNPGFAARLLHVQDVAAADRERADIEGFDGRMKGGTFRRCAASRHRQGGAQSSTVTPFQKAT
jgi:hypothetical protein